jgi:GDP-L-fucose synthase
MSFWDGKKVLVTGGAGFIGSHVVEELFRHGKNIKITVADNLSKGKKKNLENVKDVRLEAVDLLQPELCQKVCKGQDIVLNLAARVGGVGYNIAHPGLMFRENMLLASHMLEAARLAKVERYLVVSSACVYPSLCTIPTPESEGFKDSPEDTNDGYGWAKRMAEFEATAYHREFDMKIAIARPYNCYGPRDHFNPQTSHVIPALIQRVEDGENPLRVWGDGTQTRAFLYVEDLARGLIELAERYAECDPVNLGTTEEVRIDELAMKVLNATGSVAKLQFDTSKPSGQPRRNCDSTKAQNVIGFAPRFNLEEGLKRTVAWYRSHKLRH